MQLFLRLMTLSLLIGLVGGSVVTLVQRWQVIPLIVAAEAYEAPHTPSEAAPHHHDSDAGSGAHHHHDETAWQPQEGFERTFWTLVANVLVNAGFAALLVSAVAWRASQQGGASASLKTGLLWGMAGWFCTFAWPALGLPPDLPGEAAAALQSRQTWWLVTVLTSSVGIAVGVFGRGAWRACGLLLLAVPFLIGAPHVSGPAFPGVSPEDLAQLSALKSQFGVATGLASLVQWLVVGSLSGLCVARWLGPMLRVSNPTQAPAKPNAAA